MKNMKKLMAALLLLSMLTALCSTAFAAKFTPKQAEYGLFVKFIGNARAYNSAKKSSRTDIVVRKNSVGLLVDVDGDWCKVVITDGTMNAMELTKEVWFKDKYLAKVKDQDHAYISCVFLSGGDNLSVQEGSMTLKALNGKKIITADMVDIRRHGSLQGKPVCSVNKGKILTCTGVVGYDSRSVFFFQIYYKGKKRFVSAEFIENWAEVLVEALLEEGI